MTGATGFTSEIYIDVGVSNMPTCGSAFKLARTGDLPQLSHRLLDLMGKYLRFCLVRNITLALALRISSAILPTTRRGVLSHSKEIYFTLIFRLSKLKIKNIFN